MQMHNIDNQILVWAVPEHIDIASKEKTTMKSSQLHFVIELYVFSIMSFYSELCYLGRVKRN